MHKVIAGVGGVGFTERGVVHRWATAPLLLGVGIIGVCGWFVGVAVVGVTGDGGCDVGGVVVVVVVVVAVVGVSGDMAGLCWKRDFATAARSSAQACPSLGRSE